LKRELSDLKATVSQILNLPQEAATQAVEKALKAVMEQNQPFAKEVVRIILLLNEALKRQNTQRI
jgi:hypothetical protein